jgi:hypothetical protein
MNVFTPTLTQLVAMAIALLAGIAICACWVEFLP